MTKEQYAEYLTSPSWKMRRDAAVKRAEGRCQLCNSDANLNVHHRTYENVGREKPTDLTVLCRSCHEKFHGITGSKRTSLKKAKHPRKRDSLDVVCPRCQAPLRKSCKSPGGKTVKVHHDRRFLAKTGALPEETLKESMVAMKRRNDERMGRVA